MGLLINEVHFFVPSFVFDQYPPSFFGCLSPCQVAQSLFSLLAVIGTPATLPKPRGKSPGWKQGEKRRTRKTYPIAKKSYSCAKKSKKETA